MVEVVAGAVVDVEVDDEVDDGSALCCVVVGWCVVVVVDWCVVVVLVLLALYFGRLRHLSYEAGRRIVEALRELPDANKGVRNDAATKE